jgi:hypothetical protein
MTRSSPEHLLILLVDVVIAGQLRADAALGADRGTGNGSLRIAELRRRERPWVKKTTSDQIRGIRENGVTTTSLVSRQEGIQKPVLTCYYMKSV